MDAVAGPHLLHAVVEPEDVGALRRRLSQRAAELGASESERGRVELVATELGTNLVRHARAPRYVLVQPYLAGTDAGADAGGAGAGLEIVAVDHGPGIADVERALRGRPTTVLGQGLGCGLGSAQRLATEFDVHSAPGLGTAVLARFRFGRPRAAARLRCGAVSLPMVAGDACGDAWRFVVRGARCALLVVDGLGHGPEAARAAQAAVAAFPAEPGVAFQDYFERAHAAMRTTRGGSVSVAVLDADRNKLWFAGVGNVEGRLYRAGGTIGLAPRNGTMGMNLVAPTIQPREVEWEPGALLILHSDGLRSQIDLSAYGRLRRQDPALVAAVVHRDFERGRDDATVVVVSDAREAP
jgi:anti-sigma regulatory factor (Ser/Thr protein kinase)